ncbi:MAG: hypothetical protein AAGE01_04615 [Pseudomonadota bacterium]
MTNGDSLQTVSLVMALLLLGGCATTAENDLAESTRPAAGPERCEYVAKAGTHIKQLRCVPPRGEAERLRSLSGAGGKERLSCTGSTDICAVFRGTGG